MKKVIIWSMLTLIWIPFILLTDIYPFFRFGMFAEPVTQSIQMEQFAIRYKDANGQVYLLSPRQIGIGSLAYLMRNYYYRNQARQFLHHIHTIYPHQRHIPIREWQLLRITSPVPQFHPDTLVVATYPVL